MATIRRRKDSKSFEVQIRRGGWPKIVRTFSTAADARAWASVIESEIERGVFIDRTEAEKNTLGDLFQRYLTEISSQKKGHDVERYRLISLQRDPIAKFKVAGLSGKLMAEWRDRRLKKVSGSTTNRDLNLISHVINVARKEWGMHIENPIAMIRRPPENRARKRRFAAGEEEKLLAELEETTRSERGTFEEGGSRNPWIRPLVILAIESAMRRGELLSLRWSDVFLSDRFVRLRDTKNGESRDVPLSNRAHGVLAGLPRHISGRVFHTTADAVKKAFTRAVVRAELGDFHFHDLRHEATSRIAEKVENVLELAAITGHRTLKCLQIYYNPTATYLARKLG